MEEMLIANITELTEYSLLLTEIQIVMDLNMNMCNALEEEIQKDIEQSSLEGVSRYKGLSDMELKMYYENLKLHITKLVYLCGVGQQYIQKCMKEIIDTDQGIAELINR